MGWRWLVSKEGHSLEMKGMAVKKKKKKTRIKNQEDKYFLSSLFVIRILVGSEEQHTAVLSPTVNHELLAANVDSVSDSRVKSFPETEIERQPPHGFSSAQVWAGKVCNQRLFSPHIMREW